MKTKREQGYYTYIRQNRLYFFIEWKICKILKFFTICIFHTHMISYNPIILFSLYLSIVPLSFPLPTGNHLFFLYICESAFCLFVLFDSLLYFKNFVNTKKFCIRA